MTQIYAGARALAVLVAIVGAFVSNPYTATILVVLGAISVIGNKPEDNIRTYLVATVLLVGSKELAGVTAVGSYLATIFGGIGIAALGGSALAVLLSVYRMTMAAFASKGAAPAAAKAA
jgi:hypothetical protein